MKIKVLVIDDEKILRNNLSEMLTLHNYDVYDAKDGIEGLNKTMYIKPDIILCDIMMPKSDGFDFIKNLHLTEFASIPVIFITAKSDRIDERMGISLGASDYIRKPFTMVEVMSSIESRLNVKTLISQAAKKHPDNSNLSMAKIINGHAIRTDINIIMSLSNLLQNMDFSDGDKVELNKMLKYIERAGWQIINLTNNLYYFELSKDKDWENIRRNTELQDNELISITSILVDKLCNLYDKKNDTELYITGNKLPFDKIIYTFIIEELLFNSLKFTNSEVKIKLTVASTNEKLNIHIQDNGNGFKINSLNDIKPFTKFHHKLDIPGLGLGLFNIKQIIHLLNGIMEVNISGKGCDINLILPINYD